MTKQNPPIVEINKIPLSENQYRSGDNYWVVSRLIQYVKEQDYPVFDLPLAGICIEDVPWDLTSFKDFVHHANRTIDADLNHPIILDDNGYIADGWHRVAKAIINGKKTIKAIRIQRMPVPDGK